MLLPAFSSEFWYFMSLSLLYLKPLEIDRYYTGIAGSVHYWEDLSWILISQPEPLTFSPGHLSSVLAVAVGVLPHLADGVFGDCWLQLIACRSTMPAISSRQVPQASASDLFIFFMQTLRHLHLTGTKEGTKKHDAARTRTKGLVDWVGVGLFMYWRGQICIHWKTFVYLGMMF